MRPSVARASTRPADRICVCNVFGRVQVHLVVNVQIPSSAVRKRVVLAAKNHAVNTVPRPLRATRSTIPFQPGTNVHVRPYGMRYP